MVSKQEKIPVLKTKLTEENKRRVGRLWYPTVTGKSLWNYRLCVSSKVTRESADKWMQVYRVINYWYIHNKTQQLNNEYLYAFAGVCTCKNRLPQLIYWCMYHTRTWTSSSKASRIIDPLSMHQVRRVRLGNGTKHDNIWYIITFGYQRK